MKDDVQFYSADAAPFTNVVTAPYVLLSTCQQNQARAQFMDARAFDPYLYGIDHEGNVFFRKLAAAPAGR